MKHVYTYTTTADDYFTLSSDTPEFGVEDMVTVSLTAEQLGNLRIALKSLTSLTVATKLQMRVDYEIDEYDMDDALGGCGIPQNGVWLLISKNPGQPVYYNLILQYHDTHRGVIGLEGFAPPL